MLENLRIIILFLCYELVDPGARIKDMLYFSTYFLNAPRTDSIIPRKKDKLGI